MAGKIGIYDIAQLCKLHSVSHAILCPGSRCAPLTLAFSRTEGIECLTVIDERSAAFMALGIAESTKKPVALICTSGTAVINFGPALAEAFYRNIPLLVLTADRPTRLVGQQDGQTIAQQGIYANYILSSFHVSGDIRSAEELAYLHRTVNKALLTATAPQSGPVHVNISFEEPLYELEQPAQAPRYIQAIRHVSVLEAELARLRERYPNWLLIAGSGNLNQEESVAIEELSRRIPVLAEAVSNCRGNNIIRNANEIIRFAADEGKQMLKPQVLITFGNGVVSKNLKTFLRSFKPEIHLHIHPASEVIDTYNVLSHVVSLPLKTALDTLTAKGLEKSEAYLAHWRNFSEGCISRVNEICEDLDFGDLKAFRQIAGHLPANSIVHVANSMPVRYLNMFAYLLPTGVQVYCNRGTSGIDGSVSTSVGNAIGSGKPVWMVSGDLSFQYDSNALWNGYVPDGMRIIIMNNSGGGIFRLIDGPDSVPELSQRFETQVESNAYHQAQRFGFDYLSCNSAETLATALKECTSISTGKKIIEVFTNPITNQTVFKTYQQQLSKII